MIISSLFYLAVLCPLCVSATHLSHPTPRESHVARGGNMRASNGTQIPADSTCQVIQRTDDEIILDGWEVAYGNEESSIQEFTNEMPFYLKIQIKNFKISNQFLNRIQQAFHPQLESIKIENCPFHTNQEDYFDFGKITELKEVQISRCYSTKLVQMIKTIPPGKLTYLDISNNVFNEEELNELTAFIKTEFTRLEILNVSFNCLLEHLKPKFSGNILQITSLKSLNLSGNADLNSTVCQLERFDEIQNLEYLNLSHNEDSYICGEILFPNLCKFSNLKRLDISGLKIKKITTFVDCIHQFKSLEELIFDCELTKDQWEKLFDQITHLNLPLKLNSSGIHCKIWNVSILAKISTQLCLQNYVLSSDEIDMLTENQSNIGITDLEICFVSRLNESPNNSARFLRLFEKVTTLGFCLGRSSNLKHLEILLTNPIEILAFTLCRGFTQTDELIQIMTNFQFKKLELHSLRISQEDIKEFSKKIVQAEFWKTIEILELHIPLSESLHILKHAKFKKLRTIILKLDRSATNDLTNFELPTVRQVTFSFDNSLATEIPRFANIFPNVAELRIEASDMSVPFFTISHFLNLRVLKIECRKIEDFDKFDAEMKYHQSFDYFIQLEKDKKEKYGDPMDNPQKYTGLLVTLRKNETNELKKFLCLP